MQNMPIGIFRGDDTDAFSYQTIVGTINTDLDLTGCKAVFRYLGFSMEFDPISEDRKLTIVIPADETKKFPPGLGYASLRVYDSDGRLKTFSNRIMVFVATKTPMFGSDEFEVDFNVRASLEPLKFFVGPNPDDFDEYRGYLEKVIDRASASKYGLAILLDAIDSDLGAKDGVAATPVAVKAAYAAIIEKLTNDYYTAEQTDEAIDRVAAYYITRNAAGDAFETKAQLNSATVFYSGGKVRVPTRNDYCVVLADESQGGAEYRYIYAVAEGQTTGSWQPQFPVEGVMTIDQTVTRNSQNPVSGGGVWSAIWGALSALPTGVTSLYDWCVAQLAGKASKADATLTPIYSDTPTYSEWDVEPATATINGKTYPLFVFDKVFLPDRYWWLSSNATESTPMAVKPYDPTATSLTFTLPNGFSPSSVTATRIRTDILGYRLGPDDQSNPNRDKPLASEAEAEALRTGKQDALSAQQLANIAAVSDALAFDATHSYAAGDPVVYNGTLYTFTATHTGAWTGSDVSAVDIIARLAGKLDKSGGTMTGNLTVHKEDGPWAEIKAETAQNSIAIRQRGGVSTLETDDDTYVIPRGGGTFAMTADIPYILVTKTINNGAVTLDDRASNVVAVSATLSPNKLTINFPTAPTGKLRDFAMRLNIAAGVTAPEIAWPQGVTLENNGGEVPEIADGGTGGSSTILYFSESENNGTTAKFTVKGETLTAITQA